MSKWKEYCITDFAEILNHKRIPLTTIERRKIQGKYPYYGASGIIDYIDKYIFEGEHLLVSEDGENLKSRQTPIAFRADGKFWVNNHAHILKGEKSYSNKILEYVLQNLDLSPYITGAVQPKLSKGALESIRFNLPNSEKEIEGLAEVLSSLDDKIDLLHRQNKTLEELTETIFRQWFVEEAEESWEISNVGKQFETKGGGTPSTTNPSFWDGDINWTSPRDLSANTKIFMQSTLRKITKLGLSKISSGLLPIGTVLLSSRAPIGYLAITNIDVAINQGYIACIPNSKYNSYFIYNWLKANIDIIHNSSNGSTFMEISKSVFREIEFIVPPDILLNKFNEISNSLYSKILINETQIQQLESLRDNLLPKLMSGEVRINN